MSKKDKNKTDQIVGPETITMERKMRIRLLQPNGAVVSDRLVMQNAEFAKGPADKHSDPIQIEFCLADKGDAVAAQEYIGKLMLDLPIDKRAEKKAYKKSIGILDDEPIRQLYEQLKAKADDQNGLITILREKGFVFRTPEWLKLFGVPIEISEKHAKYQFMVRAVKLAKNPKADKYDPQLAFGFILGKNRVDKVKVYMYKQFKETLGMPWTDKTINYTKKEMLVFPHWMNEKERMQFSIDHRKLKQNPDAKPSRIYERFKADVKFR